MKRKIVLPITILVLIVVDQLVKWAVVGNIKLGEVKGFIPSILRAVKFLLFYKNIVKSNRSLFEINLVIIFEYP